MKPVDLDEKEILPDFAPAHKTPQTNLNSGTCAGQLLSASKIRIGLVDPDPDRVSLVEDFLNHSPTFSLAVTWSTGETALANIPRTQCRVVVIARALSDMSGLDCVRLLIQLVPDLPILIFSEKEDPSELLQTLLAGASGCLLKSMDLAELEKALTALLQAGAYLSPKMQRLLLQSLHRSGQGIQALTPAEQKIVSGWFLGLRNKEIASQVQRRLSTIKTEIYRLYHKLGVKNKRQAMATLFRLRQM